MSDSINRLITAVEGECDGLAITREQAKRIIDYVTQSELCDDEGCPHYGTPHVCVNNSTVQTLELDDVEAAALRDL